MYDLIIIGAGPAGLSAAVYAKRAGLKAVTLDSSPMCGGQILNTYEVDNYLGFKGISGMDLGIKFKVHADALGCQFITATATKVNKTDNGFSVETDKETIESKAVIFAMGADHSKLGVPGEDDLSGMGVSYCATCDGAFFRSKDVAVVGGGDVAVEDAIFLSRGCNKVYLIHRRDELRAAKILQNQLLSIPNVTMVYDSVIKSIEGNDQVENIKVLNVKDNTESEIKVDGVFIAVGLKPNSEIIKDLVDFDEKGFIISDEDCQTKTPGLFVAGDLRTKRLRQVVTAVSDGANAVTSVEDYFNRQKA
ncbi:MAG: thioredoxin-disulfide reductase [Lachnospiraceae bacterium]|nr:thioredoxin-disulfide reductase [Lachnospiraceae bacterium]